LRKKFLRGCTMTEIVDLDDMRDDIEELRALVNTLLTIIMEEADGVQSGAANAVPELPRRGYSM
tara:strand:+ start:971 stop:1162 length:192 start_codon:yes stop_codon:yes gene_type:complete